MSAMGRDIPVSFDEALRTARKILGSRPDLVARGLVNTEAEQIVVAAYRKATGEKLERVDLFTRLADRLPDVAGEQVLLMAGLRAQGRLLQHLTGYQAFLDHEYEVGPDVLVPRPETEVLLTESARVLELRPQEPKVGLEVGIGSGILSIEMLVRFRTLQMIASELTPEAEARARTNAMRILGQGPDRAGRLKIFRSQGPMEVMSGFAAPLKDRKADFIISNPPYLVQGDPMDAEVVEHEPRTALFAPANDPNYFYREIARVAPQLLMPAGWVFLEIPGFRTQEIAELFPRPKWETTVLSDLGGQDRVLMARYG